MPSVLWLSTAVSFFHSSIIHPLETLSLPIERPPTVLSIPLSPNSSSQWLSPSSSFHRLWFSWFLTRSISSGIFSKYYVYFSFFFVFNFCRLLCVILNFFIIFFIIFSCFVSVFLPLYFFPASIFRSVFRKIILSYNFILFYFSYFFLINFFTMLRSSKKHQS
jgi:hypothetical protein